MNVLYIIISFGVGFGLCAVVVAIKETISGKPIADLTKFFPHVN